MYNSTKNLDRAPIQVILTDSVFWSFYYFDFATMSVWRGATSAALGYRSTGFKMIVLPSSEMVQEYVLYLKIGKGILLE